MINTAYWISPKGEIIPVSGPSGSCHIQAVINNPQTFGLDLDYIKDVYDKHNEELGSEGKAREEIILELVRKGWIRIRRYKNQQWSFNIQRETKKIKDLIFDWANKITDKGIFGQKENDIYMPVKVFSILDDQVKTYTIKDLLSGAMYESYEKYDSSNVLIESKLNQDKMVKWTNLL